jgi:tRNA (adenine22-N1)-methyltransferase
MIRNIRIRTIADMVKEGMVTADIGTDHAFLPIQLMRDHKVPKVYACDVSAGPLKSAEKNITEAGFRDGIQTVLSDGLKNVPQDAQCVVIAGMGWITARHILKEAGKRVKDLKQIIVEVNKDVPALRRWISEHHYTIDAEAFIEEKGHAYTAVSFTPDFHESYEEAEILCGPVLLKTRPQNYMKYLSDRANKIERILDQSNGKAPKASELKRELQILKQILS